MVSGGLLGGFWVPLFWVVLLILLRTTSGDAENTVAKSRSKSCWQSVKICVIRVIRVLKKPRGSGQGKQRSCDQRQKKFHG